MTNLRNRVDRLESRCGRPGQEPNMMHWPFLFQACAREDGSFVDEPTYTAACRRIGAGLAWPSYAEMLDIWREADERLRRFHAELEARQ